MVFLHSFLMRVRLISNFLPTAKCGNWFLKEEVVSLAWPVVWLRSVTLRPAKYILQVFVLVTTRGVGNAAPTTHSADDNTISCYQISLIILSSSFINKLRILGRPLKITSINSVSVIHSITLCLCSMVCFSLCLPGNREFDTNLPQIRKLAKSQSC